MIELFEALANEPSRTGKQKLLAINARTAGFKEILRYALDPYRRYYIRKLPPTSHPRNCSNITWKFVFRLLDQLSARKLTGNDALEACVEASGKMTAGDAALFQRILLKDLRCGVSINTVNSVYKGLLPEFKLQLAGEYDPAKAAWPAAGDIKYDGMRAVAIVTDDVEFLSRGGRAIKTMDHLKPAIQKLLPIGGVFDGELIVPAGAFESSMSAAKRDAPKEGVPVSFVVFDTLTMEEWQAQACKHRYSERRQRLEGIFRNNRDKHLMLSLSEPLANDLAAQEYFNKCRSSGYEGAIIKQVDGLYEFKRSRAWMKLKASDTVDVEITGAMEGQGKYKGKLGALMFRYKGADCRAGTGFSDKERDVLWNRYRTRTTKGVPLVGLVMEVEFTELTGKGRTRHARFIRLREHDGERS